MQRGLGNEMLQFHNERNKKYKSYKRSQGLTRSEIKKLGLTFLVSPVWLQRLLLLYELQGFLFYLAVEHFDEIVASR